MSSAKLWFLVDLADEEIAQRQKDFFLGYAKERMRWSVLIALRKQMHKGEERKGRVDLTSEFSSFGSDDDERQTEEIISSMMEGVEGDKTVDDETITQLERLFGVSLEGVELEEADKLREILFETVIDTITSRKEAPNSGLKLAPKESTKEIERIVFQAVFVDKRPLKHVAAEKGMHDSTLRKAQQRIMDFLVLMQSEIRESVADKIQEYQRLKKLQGSVQDIE